MRNTILERLKSWAVWVAVVAHILSILVLLEVITQVFTAHKALPKVIVGSWTPRGPEGGCVGGEWTLYAALDPCLGVIEEPSP